MLSRNYERQEKELFKDRCLPVCFTMGQMLLESAYQGRNEAKEMIQYLKNLSRTSASAKLKNSVGSIVWAKTQEALNEICTTSTGPHSYQVLDDLCKKYKIQAVVFSGLLPQPLYTFPSNEPQSRPDLPCIFMQEIVTLNPEAKTQFHVNLITRPETIFRKKHLCQACFSVVNINSIHRRCVRRKTCFVCLRKRLLFSDHYDSLMVNKYCPSDMPLNHPSVNFINTSCPTCQEKISTECCLTRHTQHCKGLKKCETCSQLIVARRGQNLDDLVALHRCGVKKCLICFEDVDPGDAKTHSCKMASVCFPRGFNQQGYLDVETFQDKNSNLIDNVVHFAYESQMAGCFHSISFTHEGLRHPFSSVIRKNVFVYDYLDKLLCNEIDQTSSLIKPRGKKRKRKKVEADDDSDDDYQLEHQHWDLESYVRATEHKNDSILADYQAYYKNLKKFHNRVSASMRSRPLYKFLCFLLNDRHMNRTVCSHFGSRFDMVLTCEYLVLLGFTPHIIPQGRGILQMVVKEYKILFLDTYKYFPQSLASLPKRFNLTELCKGFFPHPFNRPENWGLIRQHPPPLEDYLSSRDSDKVKEEKKKWWNEEKSKEPEYNFALDIVKYCESDVHLLMASCTRFLHQSMAFGRELIRRFGQSPSYREGLTMPIIHPFNHGIPTLGSYG